MGDEIQRETRGRTLAKSRGARAGKYGALRASFRDLEDAPVGIAVVHGETHTIVYANASFRHSSGLRNEDVIGRPMQAVLENASINGLNCPAATELVAVLDRARAKRKRAVSIHADVKAESDATIDGDVDVGMNAGVSIGATSGERNFWRCMAWPVRGHVAGIDELVVELWYVPEEKSSLVRQREITERMLLSALRERTLSEDNARLYEVANVAHARAVEARRLAERARWEAEQAQHAAEAANMAKAEFLANMSHELRTPLNAIGGYAQLIEMGLRGAVTAAQLEDLAKIRRSQSHLLGLINAVLNYAKLEAGRTVYTFENLSLDDLVVDAELLVDPQLHAKGLHYRYSHSIEPEGASCMTPTRVHADSNKLRQIVLNLLTNAIKYTAAGGLISVACRTVDGMASVSVSDTGRGIPADKLQVVFDPFVQLAQGLNSPDPGVGLGLAISRDLAKGMAGNLTVESVEGKGSTFTLSLPAAA
jgi:signal transduction histidine kinase